MTMHFADARQKKTPSSGQNRRTDGRAAYEGDTEEEEEEIPIKLAKPVKHRTPEHNQLAVSVL